MRTSSQRAIAARALVLFLALFFGRVGRAPAGGYSWVDDRSPGHAFADPRFLDPQVLPLQGSATAPVALPFTFPYFGRAYDHAEATADGRIVLRFLGAERERLGEDGLVRVDDVAPQADVATLDVFGGVRPGGSSTIVFNASTSPGAFVTFRWASFEAGPAVPVTFEAHLREDGAIRFQYWQMSELLESPSYGLVGDIGLSDPVGGAGLRVMTNGNPAPGFSLRTASVLDFGRDAPDLPGPEPRPTSVQCAPAYGLPDDFQIGRASWRERVCYAV